MKQVIILLATLCTAFTTNAQDRRAAGIFFSGNGLSNTTAYEINTPAQLAKLAELVNSGDPIADKYFKLTADIDLSAYGSRWNNGKGWIPVGNALSAFTGDFNGNNHKISGLYINDRELEFAGLFGVIINFGAVENLNVDVNITGGNHAGGIAGGVGYYSTITNCSVTGNVSGNVSVGGIAGQISGSMSNCYSATAVNGNDIVGGIAGSVSHNGSVTSCYATGAVSGNFCVGGVAGVGVGVGVAALPSGT
jgi:hypothetical protein